MIINMTGGGGGDALNFKVVPGLTQPGTASENTIWVKTEQIGYWCFSATKPENMQEWDVWFENGTESDYAFNALRKNGLQVYPLSAKQYVSGAWVDVTAKSYQNGEWVDWFAPGEIVKGGIISPSFDITGKLRSSQSFPVTPESGYIRVNATTSASGGIATSSAVDVTNYSKITLKCNVVKSVQGSSGIEGLRLGLSKALNADSAWDALSGNFVASVTSNATGIQSLECDIAGVSGKYYPAISMNATSSVYPEIHIYDFYLS